ncbi:MAG: lytic transglycosylase domain-containing protein [Alphaproteobacteria bacterium]|nr:MAG: lytic transglycosylase domain-containing protein [Alphaproteobacteria bacterium]
MFSRFSGYCWVLRECGSVRAGIATLGFVAMSALCAPYGAAEQLLPGSISPVTASGTDRAYEASILQNNDVELYRKIFDVQQRGDWPQADRLVTQLADDVLIGYVKFQRYMHPTAYKSKFSELRDWMASYADHPEAARIYKLAMKRKPAGSASPNKALPRKYRPEPNKIVNLTFAKQRRSASQRRRVAEINRYVKSLLARERPTQSLNHINQADIRNALTPLEYDQLLSWIAAQYLLEKVPEKALRTAQEVAGRSRKGVPLADWTAGLAAWQLGRYELAAEHFDALAYAPYVRHPTRASGAYWAARAYLVTQKPDKVASRLEIAAQTPLSFYGVLANRQLGNDHAYDWEVPALGQSGAQRLFEYPVVRRAVALAQLGRTREAETELRRGHAYIDDSLDKHLVALAAQWDLPATQLQVAEYTTSTGLEAGLFPIPSFVPRSGFQIDPALLYAFMRKESKFVTDAKSWAGARGLMQLMPRTASYVANDSSLRGSQRHKLFDPGFNLELGQKYLKQLMSSAQPKGNLFMVTVAYNGGPGNLRKWRNELSSNTDPLFFIETIPSRETRAFIEEVLTNLWIYRYRLGQEAPTLEAAAAGKWPVYTPVQIKDDRLVIR